MRIERTRRLCVEDLRGPLVSRQEGLRRLDWKKEASKVVRFMARFLESNLKRLKRTRELTCVVNEGFLLAFEFSQQGEMGIERRAIIPGAQVGDHTGEPVVHGTRRDKPEMKHTHGRYSKTYSTVTLFARLRGRSTSMLRNVAT